MNYEIDGNDRSFGSPDSSLLSDLQAILLLVICNVIINLLLATQTRGKTARSHLFQMSAMRQGDVEGRVMAARKIFATWQQMTTCYSFQLKG